MVSLSREKGALRRGKRALVQIKEPKLLLLFFLARPFQYPLLVKKIATHSLLLLNVSQEAQAISILSQPAGFTFGLVWSQFFALSLAQVSYANEPKFFPSANENCLPIFKCCVCVCVKKLMSLGVKSSLGLLSPTLIFSAQEWSLLTHMCSHV